MFLINVLLKSAEMFQKNSAIFTFEKYTNWQKNYMTIWLQPHQMVLFTAGLIWFWFEKNIPHYLVMTDIMRAK